MENNYIELLHNVSFNDEYGNECIRLRDLLLINDSFKLSKDQLINMCTLGGIHQLNIEKVNNEDHAILLKLENKMNDLRLYCINKYIDGKIKYKTCHDEKLKENILGSLNELSVILGIIDEN